jgi:hypothetical protein
MKKSFYLTRLIGFLLIFSAFVLVGCDNPTTSDPDADGPANGTPWVFENQSDYIITVSPQDGHLDQGWKSFSLSPNKSKTIRVDKTHKAIYITYMDANYVTADPVSGENKWIFRNK